MIVTLTPNPSLDRTVEVAELVRGAVLRADAQHLDAGGKGVNVARALAAHGHPATAVVPLGGLDGDELGALLERLELATSVVPVTGATRSNLAVVEADGTTTKLNAAGPELSEPEVTALLEATRHAAVDADWVVACGSLPPGVPEAFYAELSACLRRERRRVAVDTSGAPLREALPAGPDLIKPNHEELADAVGHPVLTVGDAVAAARELRGDGAGAVLVSLGADGALLVDAAGAVHGTCPVEAVRSTVGSGDALLAGFLAAGASGPRALATGLAWGAAATELPGTRMPRPHEIDLDRVVLSDVVPEEVALTTT